MQAVCELDKKNANVLRHRNNHLADGFSLSSLTKLNLIQFGHAVHQKLDSCTELLAQLFERIPGIFNGIVEKCAHDRVLIHTEFSKDRGNSHWMCDVRFSGLTLLILMTPIGHLVGTNNPCLIHTLRTEGADERLQCCWYLECRSARQPRQTRSDPWCLRLTHVYPLLA